MPRRRPVKINIHHERWLVSYADFITLLFAFFVVMYSVSQVSETKYRVLSDTLVQAFNVDPQQAITPIQVGQPMLSIEPSVIETSESKQGEQSGDGAFEKTADLPQLSDQFTEQFSDLINDQLVRVNSNEFWLQVELNSNILFPTASASPSLQALAIFDEISQMLKDFNNPVQVEGFTDNVPIKNRRYPSNWELSSARATAVVKLLIRGGVIPQRLSSVGYGEYQPIADNNTEQGRAQNRRVVLMIARERVKRPGVKELEDLERALKPAGRQVSQPYPQPGLSAKDQQQSQSGQSAGEAKENQSQNDVGKTKPVELKDGGILFSSDPELPREN